MLCVVYRHTCRQARDRMKRSTALAAHGAAGGKGKLGRAMAHMPFQPSGSLTVLLLQLRRGLAAGIALLNFKYAIEGRSTRQVFCQLEDAGIAGWCHRHWGWVAAAVVAGCGRERRSSGTSAARCVKPNARISSEE